jgi:putative NADH-flavin reductase
MVNGKSDQKQDLLIFGGTGKLGRRLIRAAQSAGYHVTTYVRSKDKLASLIEQELYDALTVIEGDGLDAQAVGRAMGGYGTAINAAGNAFDGESFLRLCQIFIYQAELHLESPKRIWMLGGAGALDIGDTGIMGVDCPGVPAMYVNHKINYQTLLNSSLDWSFMCPGPLIDAIDSKPRRDLRISTEQTPFEVPSYRRHLPRIALSLTMKAHLPEMVVSYEDIADIIIRNLSPNGPYSLKRVGVALPLGMRAVKPDWRPGQRA